MNIFKNFFSGKISTPFFIGALVLTKYLTLGTLIFFLIGGPSGGPNYNSSIAEVNPGSYKIYFMSRLPRNMERDIEISSINTDGTDLKVEGNIDTSEKFLDPGKGIFEDMGGYDGDGKSPSGDKEIIVSKRRFAVKKNGKEESVVDLRFPYINSLSQVFWLPNNRDIVIETYGKIGILNTDNFKYAYLTDGTQVSLEAPKKVPEDKNNPETMGKWGNKVQPK